MSSTFRERYCAHHRIPVDQFEESLFRRTLYGHVRLIAPLWRLVAPEWFEVDREFIRTVGLLRSRRMFHAEAGEFHGGEMGRKFGRRWLRVRVSADRVREEMEACWHGAGSAPQQEKLVSSR
jgi:hypothetical protein